MEVIKVIFFALGSFFGLESSTVISEFTEVNIDTENKIITITQNNLISLIRNESDSLEVSKELLKIKDQKQNPTWRKEFDSFSVKTFDIYSDNKNQQINAKIKLKYNSEKDLKLFAIDYVQDKNSYAFINIDSWNIETSKGNLNGNYWYFEDNVSFTLSPPKKMPKQYVPFKKSLYRMW